MINRRIGLWVGIACLLLAIAYALLALLPLSLITSKLPPDWSLTNPTGNLISGEAADLSVGGISLGKLRWHLHPLSVLTASPTVTLTLGTGWGDLSGELTVVNAHSIDFDEVRLEGSLNNTWPVALPEAVTGKLSVAIEHIRLQDNIPTEASGHMRVSELTVGDSKVALGDYEVSLASKNETVECRIRATDSTLPIDINLLIKPQRQYQINGLIRQPPPGLQSLLLLFPQLVHDSGNGQLRLDLIGSF